MPGCRQRHSPFTFRPENALPPSPIHQACLYRLRNDISAPLVPDEAMDVSCTILTRKFHQLVAFMAKACRGDAVVSLPRFSNNAGHGSLRLTHMRNLFSSFTRSWGATMCSSVIKFMSFSNAPIWPLFFYPLKRFHEIIGLNCFSCFIGTCRGPTRGRQDHFCRQLK